MPYLHPFGNIIYGYEDIFVTLNRPTGLINPTKSNPHFINGSYGKVITNLTKLCVAKPPTFWHASQDLQNS
jgi:hypothetical protein